MLCWIPLTAYWIVELISSNPDVIDVATERLDVLAILLCRVLPVKMQDRSAFILKLRSACRCQRGE